MFIVRNENVSNNINVLCINGEKLKKAVIKLINRKYSLIPSSDVIMIMKVMNTVITTKL